MSPSGGSGLLLVTRLHFRGGGGGLFFFPGPLSGGGGGAPSDVALSRARASTSARRPVISCRSVHVGLAPSCAALRTRRARRSRSSAGYTMRAECSTPRASCRSSPHRARRLFSVSRNARSFGRNGHDVTCRCRNAEGAVVAP